MMFDLIVLFGVGVLCGGVNTVAGGGSLLSLPILIFLGVPPLIANATNRVGIVMQNVFAITGFHQKGVNLIRFSLPLGISSIVGAYVGAKFSLELSDSQFKLVLALVMMGVILISLWNPAKRFAAFESRESGKYWVLSTISFFFVGVYGGFIQAGVGFLSISATMMINRFDLVKANCVKVTVALFYAFTSVIVFASYDMIWWRYGIALGFGTALGGWLMSRHSVLKGHAWIQKVVLILAGVMAFRLLLI